jgi:hypothetical protein
VKEEFGAEKGEGLRGAHPQQNNLKTLMTIGVFHNLKGSKCIFSRVFIMFPF